MVVIAIFMIVGMTLYETAKQIISPDISIWQSHVVTIVFSTLTAVIVSFFILKKHVRFSKELKNLQTKFEQNHLFLANILNCIPDRIFVKDEHHRYTLLNDAFCSSMGLSREELIGKSDADIHSKAEKDIFWEKDDLVLNTGRPDINEETYVTVEGSIRTVLTQKTLHMDSTGKKHLVGITHDITERKNAEDTLKDEIWKRRILLGQSLDGIVVLDNNGSIMDANQRFADMLGYPLGDLFHLHVWDWDVEYAKEKLQEMMLTIDERGENFRTRHRRKDGSIIDVEISSNGALFGEEKLIFCVCRDITERKHAEKERIKMIRELQNALAEIKTLRGILPICASCKKIRDDKGYWTQIESYIHKHSDVEFSHGICPDCAKKLYGNLYENTNRRKTERDGS